MSERERLSKMMMSIRKKRIIGADETTVAISKKEREGERETWCFCLNFKIVPIRSRRKNSYLSFPGEDDDDERSCVLHGAPHFCGP